MEEELHDELDAHFVVFQNQNFRCLAKIRAKRKIQE